MPVADVEHRQGLVDADDAPVFDLFRQWSSHSPGARGQVQHKFIAFDRQHLDQFLRKRIADTGHCRTPVELGGVSGIVESCFVFVAVFVVMLVIVSMRVFMAVGVCVLVTVTTFVAVNMLMPV
jgi:hypothetical protein